MCVAAFEIIGVPNLLKSKPCVIIKVHPAVVKHIERLHGVGGHLFYRVHLAFQCIKGRHDRGHAACRRTPHGVDHYVVLWNELFWNTFYLTFFRSLPKIQYFYEVVDNACRVAASRHCAGHSETQVKSRLGSGFLSHGEIELEVKK